MKIFMFSQVKQASYQRILILTRPHCFHPIEGVTKFTKPSIWFVYILLCKITFLYNVLSISKILRHKCPVLGPHYYSSAQKMLYIWSAAVNSKASYWRYTCVLYFPHIILSCYRCRRMSTFVLWLEMGLLYQVLIGDILKSVIRNCSDKKSALVSLSPPQTPLGLFWVWSWAFKVKTYYLTIWSVAESFHHFNCSCQ
jgi:hypothetical protein